MKKRIITAITMISLCLSISSTPATFAKEQEGESVLLIHEAESVEGENYGHIPVGYTVPVVEGDAGVMDNYQIGLHGNGSLPVSYDARDYNHLTSVKNQGTYGTCWAFVAMGAAESDAIIEGRDLEPDYSEAQMAWFTYNKVADPLGGTKGDKVEIVADGYNYLNIGGNGYYSTMSLASWISPADEAVMRYEDVPTKYTNITSVDESYAYEKTVAHLQNAYWISMSDPESIKKMIMQQGVLDSSMYYNASYFEKETLGEDTAWLYYNPVDVIQNHEISLVGWDDTISAELFTKTVNGVEYTPAGDGAWLIKNSYGATNPYSDQGYFWISYYDSSLMNIESGCNMATAYDFEAADNYDYNYQYDGSYAMFEVYGQDYSESIYAANVFTTQNSMQQLEAVGFYTTIPNMKYSIQVYKVDTNRTPIGEALLSEPVEGLEPYAGYHTVKLNEKIILDEGDRFSVVVKNTITTDGYTGIGATVFIDAPHEDGYLKYTSAGEAGQSYLSFDGVNWEDMYDRYEANLRVKAFTSCIEVEDVTIEGDSYTIGLGEEITLSATIMPENAAIQDISWSSDDEDVVTVDAEGKVTAVGPGKATITVTTIDGNKTDTCQIIVKGRGVTPEAPTMEARTKNSITLNDVENCLYSLDKIKWQESNVFSDLTPGTEYTFYVKTIEDENNLESLPSEGLTVSTYSVVANVTITPSVARLEIGNTDTIVLKATVSPDDVMDMGVYWSSSDPDIASVDTTGNVTAVAAGKATITVKTVDGGFTKTCTVEVWDTYDAPEAPEVDSKTSTSVTLKSMSGCQYSKDGKTWQDSNVFSGLKADTEYTFYAKKLASGYYKESATSAGIKVTTEKEPTTEEPTTEEPTTEEPTTEEPTTEEPTTQEPTTQEPTTEEPTTEAPTTEAPTTEAPTTEEPTTEAPTTEEPTTEAPTTEEPTTEAPTTQEPTTEEPIGGTEAQKPFVAPDIMVSYRTHIQTFGWEGKEDDIKTWKSDGTMSGTSGKAKRLEGINIVVEPTATCDELDLGIQYTTHCQSYGWLPWSADGDMNGTEGESKRVEAIMIQLTGEHADYYDVYYRVHAQTYGWLGWAKNGAPAGTAGYAKRLEGIQIVVVKKGESFNEKMEGISSKTKKAFEAKAGNSPIVNYPATSNTAPVVPGQDMVNVAYRTHVQSIGWQGWKYNGQMSGTSGLAKRLEGIEINLTNKDYEGGIAYCTHVQTYGWQGADLNKPSTWKQDGDMAGTFGEAKRLEAICITLTGEMAEHYDIYYRVHAQSYGWLGWAKNGAPSGTAGYAKRLEGIQIVIVPKGDKAPANNYGGITSKNTKSYIKK